MRFLLTLFGRVIFDLAILEDPETDEPAYGDAGSASVVTEARLGFVDDVGPGSTYPWE